MTNVPVWCPGFVVLNELAISGQLYADLFRVTDGVAGWDKRTSPVGIWLDEKPERP